MNISFSFLFSLILFTLYPTYATENCHPHKSRIKKSKLRGVMPTWHEYIDCGATEDNVPPVCTDPLYIAPLVQALFNSTKENNTGNIPASPKTPTKQIVESIYDYANFSSANGTPYTTPVASPHNSPAKKHTTSPYKRNSPKKTPLSPKKNPAC